MYSGGTRMSSTDVKYVISKEQEIIWAGVRPQFFAENVVTGLVESPVAITIQGLSEFMTASAGQQSSIGAATSQK
jgi:hypothetical protein